MPVHIINNSTQSIIPSSNGNPNYKRKLTEPASTHFGFIAQELKSVLPLPAPTSLSLYAVYAYGKMPYYKYADGTIVLKRKRNRKPKLIIL